VKKLICLLLSIYITSSFASNYHQAPAIISQKSITVFSQINQDKSIAYLTTLVRYDSELNIVQQLSITRTILLQSTMTNSTGSVKQSGLKQPLDLHGDSAEAYFRALPRDQLIPLDEQKTDDASDFTYAPLNAVNQLSWQRPLLMSAQTDNQNNLLLAPSSFAKEPVQVMF
jgi:hypothetical protein